ncbi:MAG: DUF389 domain-containing protein [Dehalococcoidia bacterium]|nr:DUF389 domain-containing protein [Dehalococcoidia bacterium]
MSVATDDIPAEEPRATARPVVVGASRPEEARRLLSIAGPVARARGAEVVLAYAPEAPPDVDAEVIDDRELIPDRMSARVTVNRYRHSDESAFRAAAVEHDASLLIIEWRDPPQDGAGTAEERAAQRRASKRAERLFLDPPCEAWLVHGSLGGREIRSVLLVPANGLPQPGTLRAARDLRGSEGRVVALDVHSKEVVEPGPGLVQRLDDELGHDRYEVRSARSKSRERAALEELGRHAYDLLLAEAPAEGVVPWLAAPEVPAEIIERVDVPTVIVNRPQARAVVAFRRWWDRIYQWTESLDDEQRIRVYSDLRRSARVDRDFLTLTVISTAIAALGLLLNSAAVIIGAMLVAPFMSPLIALGLAIVYGDPRFMRVAVTAIIRGTLLAYPIGILLGVLVPQIDLGGEVLARTEPSGLDLIVALLSGAAGAYAYARRDLSAALPGVAIAAALVPPLAASAIALGSAEYTAAAGAALLYVMNVTTISAAAAVIFLWFGFRPEGQRLGRMRAFFRGFAVIIVLIAAVTAAVVVLGNRDRSVAQLERSVADVVEGWLPEGDSLDDIEVQDASGDLSIRVRIESSTLRVSDDAAALAALLADDLGRPVSVDLVVIPVVRGAAATPTPEPAQGP